MKKIIEMITHEGIEKYENFVNLCIYDSENYDKEYKDIENFIEYRNKTIEEETKEAKKYLKDNYKNIKLETSYTNIIGNKIEIYSGEIIKKVEEN